MDCFEHNQIGGRYGHGKTSYQGQQTSMHRAVYCRQHQIPLETIKGLVVRHTCDNGRCINPEHLELGTYQENMDDKVQRGRSARGEAHGQVKLTGVNVQYIRDNYKARCPQFGTRALGRKFNLHNCTVSRIVRGENWSHV